MTDVATGLSYVEFAEQAFKKNDFDAALKAYAVALRVNPDCVPALHNIAVILSQKKKYHAAEAHARRAVALAPQVPYVAANLAAIITRLEKYEEAVAIMERLVEIDESDAGFWQVLALALSPLDPPRAAECIERARRLAPDNRRVLRDSGLLKLAVQNWKDGFRDWHDSNSGEFDEIACTNIPQWRGESLEGKTIILYHDQGYGDAVLFSRFLPLIKDQTKAEKVVLAVPAALLRLMEDASLADEVIEFGSPAPSVDFQSPLTGALGYVDIGADDLCPNMPYIKVPDRGPRITYGPSTILAVGLRWSGNPEYSRDEYRSMSFVKMLPLLSIPNVQFYSLQKNEGADDVITSGASSLVPDLSGLISDFADVAKLIAQLHLVISVDTAVLHVAGALNVPAIALLPYDACWRWGRDGSETTPFYPNMHLVRQTQPGDWRGVIDKVKSTIEDLMK